MDLLLELVGCGAEPGHETDLFYLGEVRFDFHDFDIRAVLQEGKPRENRGLMVYIYTYISPSCSLLRIFPALLTAVIFLFYVVSMSCVMLPTLPVVGSVCPRVVTGHLGSRGVI